MLIQQFRLQELCICPASASAAKIAKKLARTHVIVNSYLSRDSRRTHRSSEQEISNEVPHLIQSYLSPLLDQLIKSLDARENLEPRASYKLGMSIQKGEAEDAADEQTKTSCKIDTSSQTRQNLMLQLLGRDAVILPSVHIQRRACKPWAGLRAVQLDDYNVN